MFKSWNYTKKKSFYLFLLVIKHMSLVPMIHGIEMKIIIHLIRAKIEWIIAKMLGNVKGSINIVKINIFSIPSHIAAMIPKIDIIYPILLSLVEGLYFRATKIEPLKRTNPYPNIKI